MNPSDPDSAPSTALDEASIFRALFVAHPDALIVANDQGHIVMGNPAAAALLGYTIDELLQLNVDALVPDAIRPRHAAFRQAYGERPKPRPMGTAAMDLVAQRRDGTQVRVEISLSPLQDHGHSLVVAAIRDIGDYPRVKQALKRAHYSEHLAQLGQLAVNARDPDDLLHQLPAIAAQAARADVAMIYLLEPDRRAFKVVGGVGLLASEQVGALLVNSPGSIVAQLLEQRLPVTVIDYRSETRFTIPRAYLDAGLRSAMAVPLVDRGRVFGALSLRSREVGHFGEDEERFLVSLSNVLAASLQRARSEEVLNHAERLESVGQLTGGIAHDFNNLLTVIQGNLQVLEDLPVLRSDDYAQQLVNAAARAARRGADLTGKLLAFSRRQMLLPTIIDVAPMLNSLADMLRRTLDQRIRIEVDAEDEGPRVRADQAQLESALLNIAINARDAMPEGGSLSFSVRTCTALPAHVLSDLDEAAPATTSFVAITVADSGTGMPDDVKERAFEPFFTTKGPGRGTGLGLSTVYGFIKQSQGALALESELGQGTRITLYLPRSSEHEQAAIDSAHESSSLRPGLRVLLVEDDAEVRAVIEAFLVHLKCHVRSTSSAEQALDMLQDGQGFEVLLSDIALGHGMRGTELAARAQAMSEDIGVLLMSGFSAELLEADRQSPPSWELLRKPYTRNELAEALTRLTTGR